MSQTTRSPSDSVPTLVFDTRFWDEVKPSIREICVCIALLFVLYGAFVLLSGASIYSLAKLDNRDRRTTFILSLALLALFPTTTVYTVTTFLSVLEQLYTIIIMDGYLLWSHANSPVFSGGPTLISDSMNQFVSCAPTATLTINIILGDAIVCWRACVIWQGSRVVMGACVMLLLTTFALGTVDATYACWRSGVIIPDGSLSRLDPHADGTGSLYWGFSYGIAATILSLSTNLFATLAVAVKAWQSRRVLKQYVATGPMISQVQKVFLILVESGTIYCALWVTVLGWQVGTYNGVVLVPDEKSFWDVFPTVINGALVPLIAIYPMVIIVLVALNRSHMEKGLKTPSLSSVYRLPLPLLDVGCQPHNGDTFRPPASRAA